MRKTSQQGEIMKNDETPEVEIKTTSNVEKTISAVTDTVCVVQAVIVVRKLVLAGLRVVRNYR